VTSRILDRCSSKLSPQHAPAIPSLLGFESTADHLVAKALASLAATRSLATLSDTCRAASPSAGSASAPGRSGNTARTCGSAIMQ
jgi:hypothetical protein